MNLKALSLIEEGLRLLKNDQPKQEHSSIHAEAFKWIGETEIVGKKHNNKLVEFMKTIIPWYDKDEIPWCAGFVNAILKRKGYEYLNTLGARKCLELGEPVKLEDAQRGDVVVIWRGKRDGWKGHVGFFDAQNNSEVLLLGGNQKNSVNISSFPKSRVLGVRRPIVKMS